MKAIAVLPGKANSLHLAELPKPSVKDIPNGRGVLIQVLRVGVDGTDKEINAAEYGQAPPGYDFLVIGHECFGRVVEVGDQVWELKPGDYVVPTVRRPGGSCSAHGNTQLASAKPSTVTCAPAGAPLAWTAPRMRTSLKLTVNSRPGSSSTTTGSGLS